MKSTITGDSNGCSVLYTPGDINGCFLSNIPGNIIGCSIQYTLWYSWILELIYMVIYSFFDPNMPGEIDICPAYLVEGCSV